MVKEKITGVIPGTRCENRNIHWDSGHWGTQVLVWKGTHAEYVADSWDGQYDETVEATPEEMAAYQAWQRVQEAKRLKEQEMRRIRENWNYLHTPVKGDFVKNISSRSKTYGASGTVFWVGRDNYGNDKVGIKDVVTNETIWMTFQVIAVLSPLWDDVFVPVVSK